MTREASQAHQDRQVLVDRAARGQRATDPKAKPEPRLRPWSRPVVATAAVHLCQDAVRANLDHRFIPEAVSSALAVVVDVGGDAPMGSLCTHVGTDPYDAASDALATALLHLQRARAELADVRWNDSTLLQAIADCESALCGARVLAQVRPAREALAAFVANEEARDAEAEAVEAPVVDAIVARVPVTDGATS
jgi:hypothetical protein